MPSRMPSPEEVVFEKVEAVLENSQLAEAMTLLDPQEYALMAGFAKGKSQADMAAELSVTPGRISQIFSSAVRLLRNQLGVNVELLPLEAVRTYLYQLPGEKITLDGSVDSALCAYADIHSRGKLSRTILALEGRGIVARDVEENARKSKSAAVSGTVVRLARQRDSRQVADDLEMVIDDPLIQARVEAK